MSGLPPAAHGAFLVAAGELGMWSAARLFYAELCATGDPELLQDAVDDLGRHFPVFQSVVDRHGGLKDSQLRQSVAEVVDKLRGIRRLVVVGFEAEALDLLVDALGAELRLGLLTRGGGLEPDVRRTLANYAGRVVQVEVGDLPSWAGNRSALLTFLYGTDSHSIGYVAPTWMRAHGPDVRTQFRTLLGWDLLGQAPLVHPRWLPATSLDDFSDLVGP